MRPNIFNFVNEPPLDFAEEETRQAVEKRIASVEQNRLGLTFPAVIAGLPTPEHGDGGQAGKRTWTEKYIVRENPSRTDQLVGKVAACGEKQADEAVFAARAAQPQWAHKSVCERADVLLRAAQYLRYRRHFFIALMVFEAGKPRAEADAEICEAIDFLECYARAAVWLSQEVDPAAFVNIEGEQNTRSFEPLGVGVSIQPWNFPLAISCGPAAAALVMGNTVIYKPAEQTSVTGYYLARAFWDAGVPYGAFQFVPGYGEQVGDYLVRHPGTDFVAFTGSEAVGREIEFTVAQHNYENAPQTGRKKRVASVETGGKNTLIVDASADLDAALVDASDSAFGFAGQKCSALSRVVVHEAVYEDFINRLAQRVRRIPVGPAKEEQNLLGPVIDWEAYKKVNYYQGLAYSEGKVAALAPHVYRNGYFVSPMLVTEAAADSRLAQEEIFGPVLVALKARSLEEAVKIANGTNYGLTAGIHSRNPRNIEQAKGDVECGNFYINRKITGSIVEQQPFGGVKLSGNGQQAGAWDYLLNFVNRKTISENVVRRGYAPLTHEP